jgi:predicted RNA-binding protein YlqC (UPF0109 family)
LRKVPPAHQDAFVCGLVVYNVRAVVERADEVRVEVLSTPNRVVIDVFVHPDDVGLAVGDAGATIDAIRRIVWTACKKTDKRADVAVFPERTQRPADTSG